MSGTGDVDGDGTGDAHAAVNDGGILCSYWAVTNVLVGNLNGIADAGIPVACGIPIHGDGGLIS